MQKFPQPFAYKYMSSYFMFLFDAYAYKDIFMYLGVQFKYS